MKREIKFRAWVHPYCGGGVPQECYNSMDTSDNIGSLSDFFEIYNPTFFEIMQYTGLKDKNSKEIYEGDIIQLHEFITEVKFMYFLRNYTNAEIRRSEVIGNIHETPELI